MTARLDNYLQKIDYDKTTLWFLAILGFGLSFSPSVVSIALGFMALLFLLERQYKKRFLQISSNPLSYLALALVLIHIIGFLWTSDLSMANQTLSRAWKFLLIPFFMMYIKRENVAFLLSVFLLGMVVSEIVSYSIWFGLIEPFGKAKGSIPSPFMSYPYYTVYAALSAGLLTSILLFDKPKTKWGIVVVGFFLFTVFTNLIFTGGRGGQVGFFVLLFVLFSIYFSKRWLRGVIAFVLVSAALITMAYSLNPTFKHRANAAVEEVMQFDEGRQKGSVTIRLALNINYFKAFMDAPLLGHGTGGYMDAYEKVNASSAYKTHITQPHNMYLVILVQFGIIGGIIFIGIFAYMLWYGWRTKDALRAFRLAFPLFWLVIMLVNWYLYSHHTLYLFLYLSAILYGASTEKRVVNMA